MRAAARSRASRAHRTRPHIAAGPLLPLPNAAIFTDLDATLLGRRTTSLRTVRPMFRRLHAAGVAVVPITTRTLAEAQLLVSDLELCHALIVDAGGAIARRTASGWSLEPCTVPSETLLEVVRRIEDQTGTDLILYSALPEDEAARLSGLSGDLLTHSRCRQFDEPFVVAAGNPADVVTAAERLGFAVRRGARFYHLFRRSDQANAFLRLRRELGCECAVVFGDTLVDAEFLALAEIPVIVPRRDGSPDPELVLRFPRARVSPRRGPSGWSATVAAICAELASSSHAAHGETFPDFPKETVQLPS